jgi:hypothetical protein
MARGLRAAMTVASTVAVFAASPVLAQRAAVVDSAHAQRTDSVERPRWRLGGWVAGAVRQPLETRLGHVHDRDLFVVAVRASHPIVVSPRFALRSTVDVFPLVVGTGNRDYTPTGSTVCNGPLLCVGDGHQWLVPSRHTAYGAGFAPLGFEGIAALGRRLALQVGFLGGAVMFNRRIPDPGETRFNFMADGNVALRIAVRPGGPVVVAGFRVNHISNGGQGQVNPGMDSRLLFIGFDH